MGREEGGGFRMGNTCIPVADSFRYLLLIQPLWVGVLKGPLPTPGNLVENVHQIIQEIKAAEISREICDVTIEKCW